MQDLMCVVLLMAVLVNEAVIAPLVIRVVAVGVVDGDFEGYGSARGVAVSGKLVRILFDEKLFTERAALAGARL